MWWLVCLIIAVIFGIWFCCINDGDFADFLLGFVLGLFADLLVLLLCLLVSFSSAPSYESAPQPITALADNHLIQDSSFVLGCGTIDEELTYTFVKGNPEEGMTVEQVPAEDCVVKYTDKAPYYTEKRQKFNAFGRFMWGVDSMGCEEYVFYVPEGTVITGFNIDLQ